MEWIQHNVERGKRREDNIPTPPFRNVTAALASFYFLGPVLRRE